MPIEARIRTARRLDSAELTELRVAYLADMARVEPRLRLLPDVRERTEHALPVWIDQDERTLLVAEAPRAEGEDPGPLIGYATGVAAVWPPIYRKQHVGEVSEVYVAPAHRSGGVGRRLLAALTRSLLDAGAEVLRAPVPVHSEESLARFLAQGYRPLHYVLQKGLEES